MRRFASKCTGLLRGTSAAIQWATKLSDSNRLHGLEKFIKINH
jgi:hypothetical protein